MLGQGVDRLDQGFSVKINEVGQHVAHGCGQHVRGDVGIDLGRDRLRSRRPAAQGLQYRRLAPFAVGDQPVQPLVRP